MIKFFIIIIISWLVGVFGWAQIIGCIQNIFYRKSLVLPLILWVIIMCVVAFLAISVFDSMIALIIGYIISLIQALFTGKIE